jgi:hypothetical protein
VRCPQLLLSFVLAVCVLCSVFWFSVLVCCGASDSFLVRCFSFSGLLGSINKVWMFKYIYIHIHIHIYPASFNQLQVRKMYVYQPYCNL